MFENPTTSRRAFLAMAASLVAGLAASVSPLAAGGIEARGGHGTGRRRRPEHPDPRPGIDARNVTPAGDLREDVVAVFDRVREIPHVVDGIACQCGCAELEDMRSLLSCFEGDGSMAQHCIYCQGQADLAHEMTRARRSLEEIRAAVEAQFG